MMVLMATTLLVASCSKENKVNKKLDGTWNIVSYSEGGETMTITSPMVITMEFEKDTKDNGTYKMTQSEGAISYSENGTYTLTSDETLTLLSGEVGSTSDAFNITSYSKTDLTITSASDATNIIVLTK